MGNDRMNPFAMALVLLQFSSAIYEFVMGRYLLGGLFLCYTVANLILCYIGK